MNRKQDLIELIGELRTASGLHGTSLFLKPTLLAAAEQLQELFEIKYRGVQVERDGDDWDQIENKILGVLEGMADEEGVVKADLITATTEIVAVLRGS